MTKRVMVAVDMQTFYHPAPGMVHQINQLALTMPSAATLYKHDELRVPLVQLGKQVPHDTGVLVNIPTVFDKVGFQLPEGMAAWLRNQAPEEVLVVGGHTDANVLAAGFNIYNMGLNPVIVPLLNYGNDFYMHSVTARIWEQEIGKVYQSVAELQFGIM